MTTAAPEAPAPAAPFEFFDAHVVRTRRLGPTMLRITFGGEALRGFVSGGRDQRLKLFLPQPGQDAPVVPVGAGAEWFTRWRAMDPAVRGIMRSYTVREQRRHPHEELDIDFALHGTGAASGTGGRERTGEAHDTAGAYGVAGAGRARVPADAAVPSTADSPADADCGGPASRWAAAARPGDRVSFLGPLDGDNPGVDFRPPPGTDWVLLSGDETALPAIAGVLGWLPPGTPAKVWLEVPHADDIQELPTLADAEITWLVRENTDLHRTRFVLGSVTSAPFPSGTPYAWVAGESGTVKALRRHLLRERGFGRGQVKFTGYWRLGTAEEQLVEESVCATPASPATQTA